MYKTDYDNRTKYDYSRNVYKAMCAVIYYLSHSCAFKSWKTEKIKIQALVLFCYNFNKTAHLLLMH